MRKFGKKMVEVVIDLTPRKKVNAKGEHCSPYEWGTWVMTFQRLAVPLRDDRYGRHRRGDARRV